MSHEWALRLYTRLVSIVEPDLSSQEGWKWAIGLLAFSWTVRWIISHVMARRRLAELGGAPGKIIPSRIPFGIDLALRGVWHMANNSFYEYSRDLLKGVQGRTIELHMIDQRLIITDHLENVRSVLNTDFDSFGKGELTHRLFKNCFEGSIFGSEGPEWMAHRTLLRPHVAKSRPTDTAKLEKYFKKMSAKLEADQKPVDAYHVIDEYLCDAVIDIYLETSENPEWKVPDVKPFLKGVHALFKYNSFRVAIGKLSLILPDIYFERRKALDLYAWLDAIIPRIKSLQTPALSSKPEKEWTVLEAFASENASDEHYRSKLISLLSAAKDPLGLVVVWIIYELSRKPYITTKILNEIESILGPDEDALPTAAQLNKMQYLQNVIKESMRLYHPFGFNVRCPNKDTTLPKGGGEDGSLPIPVLKETPIVVNIMGVHRRPDIWGDDAEEFVPERWEKINPSPWEYLPFNRGPRNCLGQVMASFFMSYTLVRLIQKFQIVAADNVKQKIMIEMNTRMSEPVNVRFVKREKRATEAQVPVVKQEENGHAVETIS